VIPEVNIFVLDLVKDRSIYFNVITKQNGRYYITYNLMLKCLY
jgi:hypothetical protein